MIPFYRRSSVEYRRSGWVVLSMSRIPQGGAGDNGWFRTLAPEATPGELGSAVIEALDHSRDGLSEEEFAAARQSVRRALRYTSNRKMMEDAWAVGVDSLPGSDTIELRPFKNRKTWFQWQGEEFTVSAEGPHAAQVVGETLIRLRDDRFEHDSQP